MAELFDDDLSDLPDELIRQLSPKFLRRGGLLLPAQKRTNMLTAGRGRPMKEARREWSAALREIAAGGENGK